METISMKLLITLFVFLNVIAKALCSEQLGGQVGNKNNTLVILSIIHFTGVEPRDGKLCQAAQQMVVDLINKRSDILPDYRIEIDYRNEGPNAAYAVGETMKHIREMDTRQGNDANVFESPVAMGPLITGGCKALGKTVHHLNKVQLGTSCQTPSQTARRDIYPNLYRPRGPGELIMASQLKFLKEVTSLRRLAIVMLASTNAFNYEVAVVSNQIALSEGFDVVTFDASSDFNDEFIGNLKRLDIRIFILNNGEPVGQFLFLCGAHRNGIKGPKYFFIFQINTFFNPAAMAPEIIPGCKKEVMMEQYRQALFVGSAFDQLETNVNYSSSVLGHSLTSFEKDFASLTGGVKTADSDFRHNCYDRVLQASIVLDQTEKALTLLNMSLKDYRNKPQLVMRATNDSMYRVNFTSIRYGEFHYSKRSEFDTEPQLAAVWSPERAGLQLTHRLRCSDRRDPSLLSSWFIEKLADVTIISFPRDRAKRLDTNDEVSIAGFATVTAFSLAFSLAKLASLKKSIDLSSSSNQKASEVVFDAAITIGSIILNLGGILVSATDSMYNSQMCVAQVVSVVLAIALTNGCLGLRLVIELLLSPKHRRSALLTKNSSAASKQQPVQTPSSASQRTTKTNQSDRTNPSAGLAAEGSESSDLRRDKSNLLTTVCVAVFLATNVVILAAWLTSSPFTTEKIADAGKSRYNAETDTNEQAWATICSTKQTAWLAVAICFNFIPLLLGMPAVIKLRFSKDLLIKRCSYSAIITITLYLATVAVVYVVTTKSAQHLIASIAMLIESLALGIIFFPLFKFN